MNNKDQHPIWHPFTQMKTASAPIHIQSGVGAMLYDINEKSYIDAISSWWVNIHGHSHPQIAESIAKQAQTLEHVIFAGFVHTPALELANRLISTLGSGFSKIFYSDNGSTSVEVAIKMALQYWHNKGIKNKTVKCNTHREKAKRKTQLAIGPSGQNQKRRGSVVCV